jgi:hypothetical protein
MEKRRSSHITLMVFAEEKSGYEQAAEAEGENMSVWIRQQLRKAIESKIQAGQLKLRATPAPAPVLSERPTDDGYPRAPAPDVLKMAPERAAIQSAMEELRAYNLRAREAGRPVITLPEWLDGMRHKA